MLLLFDYESQLFQADHVIRVIRGTGFKKVNEKLYEINPEDPLNYEELFLSLGDLKGIIYGWSINRESLFTLEQSLGIKELMYFSQALIKNSDRKMPTVVFATLNAEQNLYEAPLRGFFKTLTLEHPEIVWKLVDLETIDFNLLEKESSQDLDEKMIRYQDGKRYVARLLRKKISKGNQVFKSDASYLITGGLGGLGLALAEWMVSRGAKEIILIGRHGPDALTTNKINEIEALGCKIHVKQVDLADKKSVANLIESEAKRLKGIFHLAGVLSDGPLITQNWDKFKMVFAPKINGGWILHEATLGIHLDLFVAFSSLSAILGSLGQVNYSAANAFLDTLMTYRRGINLPGLSVQWGPWADVGMAKNLVGNLERFGINATAAKDNFDILERSMIANLDRVLVTSVNWGKYTKQFKNTKLWLSEIAFKSERAESTTLDIQNAGEGEKRQMIKNFITETIGKIFELSPDKIEPERGFFTMGMDSLLAVELRNKLQAGFGDSIKLPATIIFDYPSINVLSQYFFEKYGVTQEEVASEVSEKETLKAVEEQVDKMSEDDINKLLGD
jgi:hypothetical protein